VLSFRHKVHITLLKKHKGREMRIHNTVQNRILLVRVVDTEEKEH